MGTIVKQFPFSYNINFISWNKDMFTVDSKNYFSMMNDVFSKYV